MMRLNSAFAIRLDFEGYLGAEFPLVMAIRSATRNEVAEGVAKADRIG